MPSPLGGHKVVVLPDMYIDAVARLPEWGKAKPGMESILRNGGGNLPIGPVALKVGGNAANTGMALARLGAQVDLVAATSPLGVSMLAGAAQATGLGIGLVTIGEPASATMALEFGGSNLMLSHAGPVADFGPARLSDEAWQAVEAADAVCVTNWSQNRKGTALLDAVARRAAKAGAIVYVDTGDPRHRAGASAELLRPRLWRNVTAWGLNENELKALSGSPRADVAAARGLSQRIGCRLDLHTRDWAATVQGDDAVRVKGLKGNVRRLTGAGDAWNAGNVAGYLLGYPAQERLTLAHIVAHRYVTGASELPPAWDDVEALIASA